MYIVVLLLFTTSTINSLQVMPSALWARSFKCVINPVDVATVAKFLLSLRLVRLLWRMLETFSRRFYWQRLDKYFQILAFLYKI